MTQAASAARAYRGDGRGANIVSKTFCRDAQAAPPSGTTARTINARLHHRAPRHALATSASPAASARIVTQGASRRQA